MKPVLAFVPICALLVLTGCSQSPEKLLAAANKYHQNKEYQKASILYQKVVIKDKTNAEAYYREGLNLLDYGKIAESVPFLRRAVDLRPGNSDAEVKLAEIYLTAYAHDPKRYKNFLPDIRDLDNKVLHNDPNSFEGIRIQALLAVAGQDYENALPLFAKANQIRPHSRDLIGWYAETLLQVQKSDQAIALVQDMLAHDKTWGQGYDFLFVQYGRGKEPEKAEAILRERVANDPSNATAIVNYSNYLTAMKRTAEAEAVIRKVLDDKKTFPNGREIVGDYYARGRQYDKALTEYKQGQVENPADSLKYQERIVALQAVSNHGAQASELAKDLAEKNPKDLSANEMYASILLQSGERADATKSLDELKKLVQNNSSDPVLHLDLARAYFGVNTKDKALSETTEAMQLEAKSRTPRVGIMVPARTVAARIYVDRGQYSKAMEQADAVLAAQPGNPDAILIRDRALIGTNEADKALPELENLVAHFPGMNDARLQLASLYMAQHQFDKAQTQFQAVSAPPPPGKSDIRGFIGLQTVKLATGKGAEAVQVMQDLVDKNPTVLPYRYQLANFQAAEAGQEFASNPAHYKEMLQKAADNYKQILKTTANSAEVWLHLGVMQRQLGQYDTALASFEQAGNSDPKSVEAFLNQAMLCDTLHKQKEAFDDYGKVLSIDPDNALALNNLAFMTADSGGNLDQAMTYAEKAKKKAPDNADVADTLGYVYYCKNVNGEALRIFRQLSQDHPKNSTFHFHFAMALLKQGDKQSAKDEAAKALQSASPEQKDKINTFMNKIG